MGVGDDSPPAPAPSELPGAPAGPPAAPARPAPAAPAAPAAAAAAAAAAAVCCRTGTPVPLNARPDTSAPAERQTSLAFKCHQYVSSHEAVPVRMLKDIMGPNLASSGWVAARHCASERCQNRSMPPVMLTPLSRLTVTPFGVTAVTGYAVPLAPVVGHDIRASQASRQPTTLAARPCMAHRPLCTCTAVTPAADTKLLAAHWTGSASSSSRFEAAGHDRLSKKRVCKMHLFRCWLCH
jgi:hypothetical protein